MPAILDRLISVLPSIPEHHPPGSPVYELLSEVAREHAERSFGPNRRPEGLEGLLGNLDFPYVQMGAISSLNLFNLDELILFSFYNSMRSQYRRVLDLGANIGLHSIVMSRCGFEVRCFEPDPMTFERLRDNLERNRCGSVEPVNAAVSVRDGQMEFTRVKGNLTGSHLSGSKPNPYGELERFPVKVLAFRPLLHWADFCKIDVEGHEKEILLSTEASDWRKTDAMAEIGSPENAAAIFDHLRKIGLSFFPQKLGWKMGNSLADLPTSYKEGSVFLSSRMASPWHPK